jgi:hypothetical protein
MLATCTDGLIGVRDRALLTFAFASGTDLLLAARFLIGELPHLLHRIP